MNEFHLRRWFGGLLAGCLAALAIPAVSLAEPADAPKGQVFVIPHTHWEGAVFKTREEYLEMGLPHIEKALYLLKKYPDYRFVLDQMCYVRPFLERYPQEVDSFQKFLKEGRLQIAGGTDSMHDNNIPSGESTVRQYLLSKQYFRDRLGYDVTTGWGLDTFGHNAQMPQILKLAGMKSYWFQRGPASPETPTEFFWKGIDGTQVPAFWLAISYGALANLPKSLTAFERQVNGQYSALGRYSKSPDRVLMAGADVWEPEEALPIMVPQFNALKDTGINLRLATPVEYENSVARRTDRPVVSGEFNPIFQGIYSTRIEVKQAMREAERLLTTAEKVSVVNQVLGEKADLAGQERAWEPVLFNEAHDLSSGVMVDKVYDDSMLGYGFAHRLGREMVQTGLASIASRADTQGAGVPVVVFNTLGWNRTDVVEADIGFSAGGVQTFGLVDSQDRPVPVQVMHTEGNDDGGIRTAHIAFIARDVPAMGYSTFRAVPNVAPVAAPAVVARNASSTEHEDHGAIENDLYKAEFNLWTGEMTSLVMKENGWQVLSGPGNVVAREHDGGDFWELYGTLNGGRFITMKKPIGAPRPGFTQLSSEFVGGNGSTRGGAVFSEFHITHPFGKNQFSTRVRVYNGLRRIDIRTEILNQEEFVRYRALFPINVKNGKSVQEIPFGAVERGEKQEFPAQNWSNYGDGKHGVTLINRGLPGNNVADGTMMLSLMRSTKLISYGYIGGFEPGVGSDSALGLGRRYTLDYAMLPHSGGWQEAMPWRAGLEFNNPLIGVVASAHAGDLGKSWGLLEVSNPQVVVTALKPSRDGSAVLRVYEASGRAAKGVQVKTTVGLGGVTEANFIEDNGQAVSVQQGAFTFDLGPYEIKTFKLRLTPLRASR
ncbi:MAG: glycoside hydrolase family 38 C-terminal domain-containing protein [Bryobacteraceae bacterium]